MASGPWRIEVDCAELCAVATAEDAVRRAEGLEAVRCIIRGLGPDLNELQSAEVIAREMMEAAEQALTTAPSSDQAHLMQSSRSLRRGRLEEKLRVLMVRRKLILESCDGRGLHR
jgi:hypothetical protein